MNANIRIDLAKSYRADDVRAASDWRRVRVSAETQPTTSPADSPRRFSLMALRQLISQHA